MDKFVDTPDEPRLTQLVKHLRNRDGAFRGSSRREDKIGMKLRR